MMKTNHRTTILILLCVALLGGCATIPQNDQGKGVGQSAKSVDPYESTNRVFYDFTDAIDRHFMEPVANAYIEYVPSPLQRTIGNFYDNLAYPNVALNAFLQGKGQQGLEDTLRFTLNSTIGLFGLFDVATPMGLKQNDEDFGQTLGVWGVDAGSYLFLPFHGPSSTRDIAMIPFSNLASALILVSSVGVTAPIAVLGAINKRARLANAMKVRDQAALDPYLFVREASLQQRRHQVYDGKPPIESYDDSSEEDLAEIAEDSSTKNNFVQDESVRDRRTDRVSTLPQIDPIKMTLDLPEGGAQQTDLELNPVKERPAEKAPVMN
jgi:phospholipid-binding lipoprotein MlaA